MRYTEPKIVNTLEATTTIQMQGSNVPIKPVGAYFDSHRPPVSCTAGAYEADE
jgi:hypothetical protein